MKGGKRRKTKERKTRTTGERGGKTKEKDGNRAGGGDSPGAPRDLRGGRAAAAGSSPGRGGSEQPGWRRGCPRRVPAVSSGLTVTSTQCRSAGGSGPAAGSSSCARRAGLLTRRMLMSFSQQNARSSVKWICSAASPASSSSAASRHSTTLSGSLRGTGVTPGTGLRGLRGQEGGHSHVEQLGRLVDAEGEAPLAQRLAQHLLERVPRLLHPAPGHAAPPVTGRPRAAPRPAPAAPPASPPGGAALPGQLLQSHHGTGGAGTGHGHRTRTPDTDTGHGHGRAPAAPAPPPQPDKGAPRARPRPPRPTRNALICIPGSHWLMQMRPRPLGARPGRG